ncbi:hypothetical protein [Occultella kanbiaonis]|uniref:hypothetical protein n=1 Tax=Occultella kanbiaonis TaxID=2675754 RepID=UPI0012B92BFC|nr:hypothetical protein [Occultella kanbiaonis]
MGLLDRILGREPNDYDPYRANSQPGRQAYGQHPQAAYGQPAPAGQNHARRSPDQVAIDRYRYLVSTAPPDAVEQAHAEAFSRLTPEQRRQVLDDLGAVVPPAERAPSDSPQDLARMATRAEVREPGTLERTFGGQRGGPGFGAMMGSSLLGTIAGVVIGSAVANALFGPAFADPTQEVPQDAAADGGADAGADGGADAGADGGGSDAAADAGGSDAGGLGDFGGGFEDFGGFGDF